MTKKQLKNLPRGSEVFNTETGEVGNITWLGHTSGLGNPLYVEVLLSGGKFGLWTHNKVGNAKV